MHKMNDAEWRSFASAGTRTGKVSVLRHDGRPHVTPVWFVLDDTGTDGVHIVFTTHSESIKGKSLQRDQRFALCVDDQEPPYSFVLLECTAELIEDPARLITWSTRIGARYMGQKRGEEFGARNAVPGEYLVRGRIDHIVAEAAVSD